MGGTAIDNGVVGLPQVQCSEDSVTFSVRTQNTFRGNVYIKGPASSTLLLHLTASAGAGKYTESSCRQEFFSNDYNGATFAVRIGQCGMQRIRQLQPSGMNYILVFVVNFHPQFVTKVPLLPSSLIQPLHSCLLTAQVDRAYNVRCFYAQQDKTVSSQLEVR